MSPEMRALASSGGSTNQPFQRMMEQAAILVRSGFLPDSIKTAEQAAAIIMTGDELGIPPMLALRSIHVIKGTPSLSADLMASLIHREIDRHKDGRFDVQPPTSEGCTVEFRRWGDTEIKAYTYTIADAQRSGLAGNDMYRKYPAAMLRARATSHAARMAFPDVIAGLYAPEELDDPPPDVRRVPNVTVMAPEVLAEKYEPLMTGEEYEEVSEALGQEPDGGVFDAETGEIETVASVKRQIEELSKSAEYSPEDVKHVAVDLRIEHGWRELTLDEARSIRDDIERRMAAADDTRGIIEARYEAQGD